MSVSVRCISVGLIVPPVSAYGWSRKKITSRPAVTSAVTKPIGIAWMTQPFAPIGLGDHVGDGERGADAQHEPQRNGHERGRLGEAFAPTFAALCLLVEPLCVCRLLPRAPRVGVREVPLQLVDPGLHQLAGPALSHRGPLVLDHCARVADQASMQTIARRRLENTRDGVEFGDGDGLDAGAFACTLIALQREENHEREHHREHGADHRQRACATGRVGEPAAFGRAAAHQQLGGDRRRDRHDENEWGEPGQHG